MKYFNRDPEPQQMVATPLTYAQNAKDQPQQAIVVALNDDPAP